MADAAAAPRPNPLLEGEEAELARKDSSPDVQCRHRVVPMGSWLLGFLPLSPYLRHSHLLSSSLSVWPMAVLRVRCVP